MPVRGRINNQILGVEGLMNLSPQGVTCFSLQDLTLLFNFDSKKTHLFSCMMCFHTVYFISLEISSFSCFQCDYSQSFSLPCIRFFFLGDIMAMHIKN